MKISIDHTGQVQFVYDDNLAPMLNDGPAVVRRASHVEPDRGGWTADLSPVGGPVIGPHALRQDALADEVRWIEENVIGS